MRIVSWNVNFRPAECLEGIRGLRPDVILLQEVKHATAPSMLDALCALGCDHACYGGEPSDDRKRYGNVIASRWPVIAASRGWAPGMPWPQLALRATVHAPSGEIDTINVHIPNGSGNGWRKVESLESLAAALESSVDAARVLGGDFNEPQSILPSRELVTWGQTFAPDGSVRLGRRQSGGAPPGSFTDKEGRTSDLQRWDTAVRRIFEGSAQHGLRHIHTIPNEGPFELPVSHIVQGKPRFFHHIFISRHMHLTGYRYVNEVREQLRYSDHSAVYADVELNGGLA